MKIKLLIILLFSFVFANSQTTFKVMQFNLLNYGNNFGECTDSNNSMSDKNGYMKTIIEYLQPDIICVQELDNSDNAANNLLNNAFNKDGRTYYQRANTNGNNYTMNMIYYDSRKFELGGEDNIWADPRRINAYRMKFKSANSEDEDAEITFIAAHLKASEGSENENKRAAAFQNVMTYVSNNGIGNYVLIGDFNIYSSSEQAYQNVINPTNSSYKFYDPVNQEGSWHENSSYSNYHTQSSHYYGDCAVGGGLDDRFDFIMISENIKDGNDHYQYVTNSYTTVAQDGNHYNDAVNYGTNDSGVPTTVIEALYNMSDHLPVTMEIEVDQNSTVVGLNKITNNTVKYSNPIKNKLNLELNLQEDVILRIISLQGREMFSEKVRKSGHFNIDLSNYKQGMYILRISGNSTKISKKIIKIN